MRTRRSISLGSSTRRLRLAFATSLALSGGLGMASAAAAQMDWSVPQHVASTTLDLIVVRPLAAVRAGVGAILLAPAALLASPACLINLIADGDCQSVYEAPYEVLLSEPADYAFRRKLGEL